MHNVGEDAQDEQTCAQQEDHGHEKEHGIHQHGQGFPTAFSLLQRHDKALLCETAVAIERGAQENEIQQESLPQRLSLASNNLLFERDDTEAGSPDDRDQTGQH